MKYIPDIPIIIVSLVVVAYAIGVVCGVRELVNDVPSATVLTDVHDIAQPGLQVLKHNLGHVPTRMVFTAYTEGTTGQTQFVYDLNGVGEKKGVGIIRLDDGKVMNGAYPFAYSYEPGVLPGIDVIWAGSDLMNRTVATFSVLDDTSLVLEWMNVGNPHGVVRFTVELQ